MRLAVNNNHEKDVKRQLRPEPASSNESERMIAPVENAVADVGDARGAIAGRAVALDKSSARVRRMFAGIVRRYDLLNHLLSLNIDRYWRNFTTRMAAPEPGALILDCCTGTADLALAYDLRRGWPCRIVAADFCREMLVLGKEKVQKARAGADHAHRE